MLIDLPDSPHNTILHINGGLFVVSTMDCTTFVLLCLLLVTVFNFYTISTKLCHIYDKHS